MELRDESSSHREEQLSSAPTDSVAVARHALSRVQTVVQDAEQLQWLMSFDKHITIKPSRLKHTIGESHIFSRNAGCCNSTRRNQVSSRPNFPALQSSNDRVEVRLESRTSMIPVEPVGSNVLFYMHTDSPSSTPWSSTTGAQISPAVLQPASDGGVEFVMFSRCSDGGDGVIISVWRYIGEFSRTLTRFHLKHAPSSSTTTAFPSLMTSLELFRMAQARSGTQCRALCQGEEQCMRPEQTWARFQNLLSGSRSFEARALIFLEVTAVPAARTESYSVACEPLKAVETSRTIEQSSGLSARDNQVSAGSAAVRCNLKHDDVMMTLDTMQGLHQIEGWFAANKELHRCMLGIEASSLAPSVVLSNCEKEKRPSHFCKICNQEFRRQHDARRHEREMHDQVRPRQCPECFREFNRESNLRRHRFTVHEQQRMYSCQYCDLSFSTRGNLIRHTVRIHKDEALAILQA